MRVHTHTEKESERERQQQQQRENTKKEMLIHFKSNQLFRFWISMEIINTVMI